MEINIDYNKVNQNLANIIQSIQNMIENPRETCENDCVPTMDMYGFYVDNCCDSILELKILLKYAKTTLHLESLNLLITSIIQLLNYLKANKSCWFNSKVFHYTTSGEEIMTSKFELWLNVINALENHQGHTSDLKKNIEGFTVFM